MAERGHADSQWVVVSSEFPTGLNKSKAETRLEDGETPDSYGMGIEYPGWLYKADAPTGDSFYSLSDKTIPIGAPAQILIPHWHYFHNRLFGYDTGSPYVYFGGVGYETKFIKQNNSGRIYVDDGSDDGNVTAICPFGNKLAIFKAESLYVVDGASSNHAQFSSSFHGQQVGLTNRGNVLSIDGMLFFVNATGTYSFDGERLTELSRPVRNDLGAFSSAQCTNLKADFQKKYLCLTDGSNTLGVIDLSDKVKLYDYTNLNSGFRFTTPTFSGKTGETILVDKIAFHYWNTTGHGWTIGVDVKINDTWHKEGSRKFGTEEYGRVEYDLNNMIGCKRWATRINELEDGVYISEIYARVKQGSINRYSEERV